LTATATDIDQLREAYRTAGSQISAFSDPLERDIGLAALRLEAVGSYRQLVTTAPGLSDTALAPLKEYVANLTGGESTEAGVEAFDRAAKSASRTALSSLWSVLAGVGLTGAAAVVVGVVTSIALAAENGGAFIFALVIGGGGGAIAVYRGTLGASAAAQSSWVKTWSWADGLGRPADHALGQARQVQTEVLRKAGAGALPMTHFTSQVRTRAEVVVVLAWVAVAAAVILVIIGFFHALDNWWASNPSNPSNFSTPNPPLTLPSK
jgi:hypothetical protein